MSDGMWDRFQAELVDTLQHEAMRKGKQVNFRTRETRREYPLPLSRKKPYLMCPFCGRYRCKEHDDLPALDPFYAE